MVLRNFNWCSYFNVHTRPLRFFNSSVTSVVRSITWYFDWVPTFPSSIYILYSSIVGWTNFPLRVYSVLHQWMNKQWVSKSYSTVLLLETCFDRRIQYIRVLIYKITLSNGHVSKMIKYMHIRSLSTLI